MSGSFQKNTGSILAVGIIGLIVVSFMFSGFQPMKGAADSIAKVGHLPIKIDEYRREYNRLIKFYGQFFGGKNLTTKQIEQFNIRKSALTNLINRKIMILLSSQIGIAPGTEEIKSEIKNMKWFKTEGAFDIIKYKNLLTYNRMTPSGFEKSVSSDLKEQQSMNLLKDIPLSKNYITDVTSFKEQKFSAEIVKISKKSLRKYISVSKSEIKTFLKEKENLDKVTNVFKDRKGQFDQKEEVKASHILLKVAEGKDAEIEKKINELAKKVNSKNFKKIANKNTEDPSGKGKGGALGWFGKNKMAPEFEKAAFSLKPGQISKPVKTSFGYHLIYVEDKKEAKDAKLAKHKNDLAKELIQTNRKDEAEKIGKDLEQKIKKLLAKNSHKSIDKLQKKYGFTFQKKIAINRLEGAKGSIDLNDKQLDKIFKIQSNSDIVEFSDLVNITIMKVSKFTPKKEKKKDEIAKPEMESQQVKQKLAGVLQQDIIKSMKDSTKVKVFNNFQL